MKTIKSFLLWLLLCASLAAQAAPPDLLLLTRYRPGMPVTGWYMSEKLDGVRAYWDGERLLTRQGMPLAAPEWFTAGLPPFPLDGELWVGRGGFQQTLSIVSQHQPHPGWRAVGYHVFEVPQAPGGLDARLARLRDYLKQHPLAHVQLVPQTVCRGEQHLRARLQAVDEAGGEGLVLRNPASGYETGRSANALKVKRFEDMEGRVVGYRPGKGKYTGMTGALEVELADGTRFFVGSGLSDQQRASPPPVGSLITFRYQGFTDAGIPRFAVFMRVRQTLD